MEDLWHHTLSSVSSLKLSGIFFKTVFMVIWMYAESHNEVIIRDEYNLCILRFNDQGDTDIEVTNSKTKGVWGAC